MSVTSKRMREGSTRAALGGKKPQIANPSHIPDMIQLCLQKEEVSFRQNWVGRDAGCIPTALLAQSQQPALLLGSSASPAGAGDGTACPELQPWGSAGETGVLQ